MRLGIAACAAAGIKLDGDLRLVALACRYSSGTAKTPDYDVADALTAAIDFDSRVAAGSSRATIPAIR